MTQPSDATVQVRDHALWIRHIAGDPGMLAWLNEVPAGATVRLVVDGVEGEWRKMADGSDGRPTPGLKPVTEPSRSKWHALQNERGRVVSFAIASGD